LHAGNVNAYIACTKHYAEQFLLSTQRQQSNEGTTQATVDIVWYGTVHGEHVFFTVSKFLSQMEKLA
jgi:hypothetical protein